MLTDHDIVDGVRKAGREDRLKAAQSYKSWAQVAAGYEREFYEWLMAEGDDIKSEQEEFADVGFEDESFPEFMYRAYENADNDN